MAKDDDMEPIDTTSMDEDLNMDDTRDDTTGLDDDDLMDTQRDSAL